MYIQRNIASYLKRILKQFPILSLTGPRQSGKTTLLKKAFPNYQYINLERIDYRELILSDPIGFLKTTGSQVIFDEAQNVPELFSYIQVISDERGTPGQYILSGSQSFLMNDHISQSLAGRAHISHLFPFDITEIPRDVSDINKIIWNGFYPRLYNTNIAAPDFYPSYLQTYIERDVRSLKAIGNLNTFSRFLGLCAGRIGQVLNLSSLANDTGITVNTVKAWLSLLESSFIIFQLQAYHKNYSKRLIKSPKIYFYDTGVACSLLRLTNAEMIRTHYLYGSLFGNLVISEIVKSQHHIGKPVSAYYWRESNGTEIDCILEKGNDEIVALEIKGGESYSKDYLRNFKNFPEKNVKVHKKLIYTGDKSSYISDVQLISWNDFPKFLNNINQ
ncbi:MAG: ATP-binding protein [Bacteroidales bacterium]|nr:ATP-binding protein [Bacteroidales bacterium]